MRPEMIVTQNLAAVAALTKILIFLSATPVTSPSARSAASFTDASAMRSDPGTLASAESVLNLSPKQAAQELAVAAGPLPPAVPPPPHVLENQDAEDLDPSDPEHASCRTAPAVISTASGSNEPPHEPLRLVPAPDALEGESTETEEPIDPDVPIVLRPPREDHPHRWVSQVDMQLPEAPTVHKVYGKGGSVPTGMLQIREQEKSRTPRGETTAIPITHPSVGLRPPHYFPAPNATEMIHRQR